MTLDIISRNPNDNGRTYRKHHLDGIDTIGVFDGDVFAIRYHNNSSVRQAVRLSVDGTDVTSGRQATSNYHDGVPKFMVAPYGKLELDAWLETTEHGARFVFTGESNAVALHTHGELTAVGYISALVWSETYRPPRVSALESLGPVTYRGGSAVGAGETVAQHIGTTSGLIQPGSPRLIQVRHVWWDELAARVPNLSGAIPSHPTGFVGTPHADLGTTPRLGGSVATQVTRHPRFN